MVLHTWTRDLSPSARARHRHRRWTLARRYGAGSGPRLLHAREAARRSPENFYRGSRALAQRSLRRLRGARRPRAPVRRRHAKKSWNVYGPSAKRGMSCAISGATPTVMVSVTSAWSRCPTTTCHHRTQEGKTVTPAMATLARFVDHVLPSSTRFDGRAKKATRSNWLPRAFVKAAHRAQSKAPRHGGP
jgi:hypothetical protein